MYNEARENIMHLEAIKILRAAIDENLLTLSKLDYGSSQADSVMALIDGLKYSIKLLR
jgi:hypothetical protein